MLRRFWRWLMDEHLFKPPFTCSRCGGHDIKSNLMAVYRGILGEWWMTCRSCDHRWKEFC